MSEEKGYLSENTVFVAVGHGNGTCSVSGDRKPVVCQGKGPLVRYEVRGCSLSCGVGHVVYQGKGDQ